MKNYMAIITHKADKYAVKAYCHINDFLETKDEKHLEISKEYISQLDELLSTLEIELNVRKGEDINGK